MAVNWDDLRFVLALATEGSLAKAGKRLGVDHTTVGRRVESAESALGVRLFARTAKGFVPTAEAEPLLATIRGVESGVLAIERNAHAQQEGPRGTVRVTAPETFGASYLAPRLAVLGRAHPALTVELSASGAVLDLGRREADVAVRFFKSTHEDLVVRRAGEVVHGLYASRAYLAAHPLRRPSELAEHRVLASIGGPRVPEIAWLAHLAPGVQPAFACDLTIGLLAAVRAGAGVAVLPHYLAGDDDALVHVPMPDEPREPIWITVHRDMRATPRVRATVDFLVAQLTGDRALFHGA
jgi:DNA-binding transcriptional LysR family regulator